jgi:hypothetical protein
MLSSVCGCEEQNIHLPSTREIIVSWSYQRGIFRAPARLLPANSAVNPTIKLG